MTSKLLVHLAIILSFLIDPIFCSFGILRERERRQEALSNFESHLKERQRRNEEIRGAEAAACRTRAQLRAEIRRQSKIENAEIIQSLQQQLQGEVNLATELKRSGMSRETLREADREADAADCRKRAIQRAEIRRQQSIVESDDINNNGNVVLSTISIANDSTSEIASPAPEIEEIQPSVDSDLHQSRTIRDSKCFIL